MMSGAFEGKRHHVGRVRRFAPHPFIEVYFFEMGRSFGIWRLKYAKCGLITQGEGCWRCLEVSAWIYPGKRRFNRVLDVN